MKWVELCETFFTSCHIHNISYVWDRQHSALLPSTGRHLSPEVTRCDTIIGRGLVLCSPTSSVTPQGRASPLHVLRCPMKEQETGPSSRLSSVEVAEVATVQSIVTNYGEKTVFSSVFVERRGRKSAF